MEKLSNKKLILASSSPRRKELLKMLGVKFKIIPSQIKEEEIDRNLSPKDYVRRLSYLKAFDVASKTSNAIVIGVDTVVVFENKILGKPQTKKKAIEMLKKLSGKMHLVITGITVINTATKQIAQDAVITKVKFGKLDKNLITKYVFTREPLDKAGAYGIQGKGSLSVESIDGDYFNVVGLPLYKLNRLLKNFGAFLLL